MSRIVARGCALIASLNALLCAMPAHSSERTNPSTEALPIETIEAVVRQPRPFGYFIGDLVRQYVLAPAAGDEFEAAELPHAERVGVWFERRPSRSIIDRQDGREWIVLEYQIVNAPQEARTIELPALRIEDASGTRALVVPPWRIGVAPLTTALQPGEEPIRALRGDRPPPRVATNPIRRQLVAYTAACTLVVICWGIWLGWRNWLARSQQPFARAWREIQRLDERAPEAWQALHRAFDRTAGRVTQVGTLPNLFQKAPHLLAQRGRIEQFYAQSSELFFGRGLPNEAVSVRALCRDLRQLEKQHER